MALRAPGHTISPLLLAPGVDGSILLGMGQHAMEGEVGLRGLANLYLKEDSIIK